MAWTLAGAGVAALVGALALPYLRGPGGGEERAVRFTLIPPANTVLPPNQSFALSPDGRRLTFAAVRAGTRQLWVRSLDSLDAQILPGTEDARDPIWSPDSRTVAFLADGKLKAVDLSGGSPRTLCDMPLAGPPLYGGSWNPDGGTIVFAQLQAGLFSVPATGGAPTALPGRGAPGEARLFPAILPDGKHFVYLSEPSNVAWIGSLASTEPPVRLMSAASQVEYVAPGYLVFLRGGRLLAQPFDARRANLAGEPVLIAEGVSSFKTSPNGALVYLSDPLDVTTRLTWVDRTGRRLGVVGPPGRYRNPEISPDDTGAVMEVVGSGSTAPDIVYLEFGRGVLTRLTSDPANDDFPIWAPDGHEIIFSSDRTGVSQLYRIRVDGTGEERVLQSPTAINPYDWTSNGLLVFRSLPSYKLGVLPLTAGGVPREFDPSQRLASGSGQVSPSGHWIAYNSPRLNPETSDRRRLFNVFVQSFPVPGGGKVQVSANGGVSPRWSRDGRELFFYAGDGWLTAVPVTGDGAVLRLGPATALFDPSLLNGALPRIPLRQQYDVTRDGRFLLNVPLEHVSDQSFTVVVNWAAGLTSTVK